HGARKWRGPSRRPRGGTRWRQRGEVKMKIAPSHPEKARSSCLLHGLERGLHDHRLRESRAAQKTWVYVAFWRNDVRVVGGSDAELRWLFDSVRAQLHDAVARRVVRAFVFRHLQRDRERPRPAANDKVPGELTRALVTGRFRARRF